MRVSYFLLYVPCYVLQGIPYSRAAMSHILGSNIQQSCSAHAAELLAIEAFRNCASIILEESCNFITLSDSNIFGVSCSAALVSSAPKKGAHRCFVSSVNSCTSKTWSIELSKGSRTREEEDFVCSRLILDAIFASSNISPLPLDYLIQDHVCTEVVSHQWTNRADGLLDQLLNRAIGKILFVQKTPDLDENSSFELQEAFNLFDDVTLPSSTVVYPGSFNPFHEGHANLAKAALSILRRDDSTPNEPDFPPIVFEIAVVNADKPPLTVDEITARLRQFSSGGSAAKLLNEIGITNFAVCVTSHPLFASKAELFPGCRFLVGADTLVRMCDDKYYQNSRENMIISLSSMANRCQIIVGGRVDSTGEFVTAESILAHLRLPEILNRCIISIPESSFRNDISSSAIRARHQITK